MTLNTGDQQQQLQMQGYIPFFQGYEQTSIDRQGTVEKKKFKKEVEEEE